MRNRSQLVRTVLLTVGNIGLLVITYFLMFSDPAMWPRPQPADPRFIDPGSSGIIIEGVPTPTDIPVIQVVVAVRTLPRGSRITEDVLRVELWPYQYAPFSGVGVIGQISDVLGQITRTDIVRGQPILSSMVVYDLTNLASIGSDVAAQIPPGLVAKTLYLNQSQLPLGLAVGDRVNVYASYAQRSSTDNIVITQIISNALVMWVGEFPTDGRIVEVLPTRTPEPTIDPYYPSVEEVPTAIPRVTMMTGDSIPLILAVRPQEAANLIWAEQNNVYLSLVMRAATDISSVAVTPVSEDTFPP